MKKICVVTPCYNEESNIAILCDAVKQEFRKLPNYEYCHLFIDNNSEDNT